MFPFAVCVFYIVLRLVFFLQRNAFLRHPFDREASSIWATRATSTTCCNYSLQLMISAARRKRLSHSNQIDLLHHFQKNFWNLQSYHARNTALTATLTLVIFFQWALSHCCCFFSCSCSFFLRTCLFNLLFRLSSLPRMRLLGRLERQHSHLSVPVYRRGLSVPFRLSLFSRFVAVVRGFMTFSKSTTTARHFV